MMGDWDLGIDIYCLCLRGVPWITNQWSFRTYGSEPLADEGILPKNVKDWGQFNCSLQGETIKKAEIQSFYDLRLYSLHYVPFLASILLWPFVIWMFVLLFSSFKWTFSGFVVFSNHHLSSGCELSENRYCCHFCSSSLEETKSVLQKFLPSVWKRRSTRVSCRKTPLLLSAKHTIDRTLFR